VACYLGESISGDEVFTQTFLSFHFTSLQGSCVDEEAKDFTCSIIWAFPCLSLFLFIYFLFIYLLAVPGIEFKVLHTIWASSPVLLALFFWIGFHIFIKDHPQPSVLLPIPSD
jgi:hypothetical protein